MILGLITPTSGEVRIFGEPFTRSRARILKKIGAIVEKPDLYGYLTAFDNLSILGQLSGSKPARQRILEVLEITGLEKRAHSRVKTFSQGMKQRLGIAQALLHNPDLILLDEPTNGLDPQGMVEIRELIRKLSCEQGKTVVLSSHILNEVELVANRMVIINKGKVAAEGQVDQLLHRNDMLVTLETSDNVSAAKLLSQPPWSSLKHQLAINHIEVNMSREQIPQVCKFLQDSGISLYAVSPVRSLEAYFLSLT
jgi:ABC-2 type transport system ATP-binding protein